MPAQNGTGPTGLGSMTGRGLGPCGARMQRGFGRGWKRSAFCPAKFMVGFTKDEEKKILEAELEEINLEKQEIEKRLKEMN